MKTIGMICTLLALGALQTSAAAPVGASQGTSQTALPPDTAYAVVERGANHRVWEKMSYEVGPNGSVLPVKHHYTELATGLNCWQNGQWVESEEKIVVLPDGSAAATNGQHQVYFPADIYHGVIELVTPDGRHLHSQPVGVCYGDGTNSYLIGILTNSVGQIISSNQVLYPNAFGSLPADLLYTYTKEGLEQDIILRKQPQVPESYGFSRQKCRVQMLTEFFDLADPEVLNSVPDQRAGLSDSTLQFGQMRMVRGRAFSIGGSLQLTTEPVSVYKSWQHFDGHKILVEELPYSRIESQLNKLTMAKVNGNAADRLASKALLAKRLVPTDKSLHPNKSLVKLAQNNYVGRGGVVLDYILFSYSSGDYIFQGDSTYYVSSPYQITGTTIIEGGAVIKIKGANGSGLEISGPLNCVATAYHPAVMTEMNDNTVGAVISGSTGNPYAAYAGGGTYLALDGSPASYVVNNLRIRYASFGVACLVGCPFDIWDCQFQKCYYSVDNYAIDGNGNNAPVTLHNCLFDNCHYMEKLEWDPSVIFGENLTVNGGILWDDQNSISCLINLTNCIISATVPTPSPTYNPTFTFNTNCVMVNGTPMFQTNGAGYYYLATNSPCHNVGTTNISADLLAELAWKTTYAPSIYYSTGLYLTTNLNLTIDVPRDTNAADLGYHYDAMDYLFGPTYVTNASVTINPGVVVGFFGSTSNHYGFNIGAQASLSSSGYANYPSRLLEYNIVQEQSPGGWGEPSSGLVIQTNGTGSAIGGQFTDWSVMAQDAPFINVSGSMAPLNFSDCEFYGGLLQVTNSTMNLTNCLLERVYADLEPRGINTNIPVIRNNTIWQGTFRFGPTQTNAVVTDNLFDSPAIPDLLGAAHVSYIGGHNAFVTNCATLDPLFPGDQILTNSPAYQSSWFGNYYLPPNSPLINAGSTTADQMGLYHFTTQTNQTVEGTSVVDIGYHYVATDAYGNPLDSNGNGIPDYLEDSTGTGAPFSISLIAPTNSAYFAEPANISLMATVSDWRNTVTNVTFLRSMVSIVATTNSPYSYTWPVVAAGAYTLTAIGQDNGGIMATSAPVYVTITNLCGY